MELDLLRLFLRSLSREPLEPDLGVVWVCLGVIADLSDLGGLWCGGGVW